MPDRSVGKERRHLTDEDLPKQVRRRAGCDSCSASGTNRAFGIRDETSTALLNVVRPVTERLRDRGRRHDPRQLIGDVDLLTGDPARDRVLRRCRHALQVVEPAHLLLGRIGDEDRREHTPEDRIILRPARPDHAQVRLLLGERRAFPYDRHAAGGSVEDQPGDRVGVSERVAPWRPSSRPTYRARRTAPGRRPRGPPPDRRVAQRARSRSTSQSDIPKPRSS